MAQPRKKQQDEGAAPAEHSTAEEIATEKERTGSVLPYKVDDIDVDSFDVRTVEEIEAQREAAGEDDDNPAEGVKRGPSA